MSATVSAPLRRSWAAALSVTLLVGLSACGSDSADDGEASASRLDAVTISGEVGTAPEVEWKSRMSATGIEVDTISEGDGAAVADGQSVVAQVWIGNGFAEEQSYSSYEEGAAQLVTAGDDSLPAITEALTGATIGSRVAVTASADEAFGSESGNPSLGIGNQDTVLLVLDLLSPVQDAPSGATAPAPSWVPAITETEGRPSAFDFAQAPAPVGKFRKATLVEGDGERVRKGMTVAVRYLGQVYNGPAPFDENFSTTPTTFQIGTGQVIDGWDKNVVGSTVGSRIVIEVPPKLGYGTEGNPDAGIAGTDTLFFVIDILGAA